MSIVVNQLVKVYGEQKAVDNISFQLNLGEIVGFLGPNGAGKSTTMKIISGYLQSDSGETVVCGINVKANPLESKKKIGYLPEANPLYYDMYIREYLNFIADIHDVKNKKARIEEVISIVGLTPEHNKKLSQLSKGYKQRVGLAAALIHDPEVLILDEPTTGLDPNQIIEIREVIRQFGRKKTVLFSSHILQEVEAICDRVVIINKGKIVADDTLANLRQSDQHLETVTVQFREKVNPSLFSTLTNVHKLHGVSEFVYQIETDRSDEVRKQLLELSLLHNLNIVSLQSGEQKLEEIFRQLTN